MHQMKEINLFVNTNWNNFLIIPTKMMDEICNKEKVQKVCFLDNTEACMHDVLRNIILKCRDSLNAFIFLLVRVAN